MTGLNLPQHCPQQGLFQLIHMDTHLSSVINSYILHMHLSVTIKCMMHGKTLTDHLRTTPELL